MKKAIIPLEIDGREKLLTNLEKCKDYIDVALTALNEAVETELTVMIPEENNMIYEVFYVVKFGKSGFLMESLNGNPVLTNSIHNAMRFDILKSAKEIARSYSAEVKCFEIKELPQ